MRKYVSLGMAYLQMGWAEGAREELEKALSLDPNNRTALLYAGVACMETDDLVSAERYLRLALRYDPENADAFAALAKLYLRRNRPAEASIYAQNALDKSPQLPMAVSVLAEIEIAKGRLQRAESILNRALEKNPDAAELHEQIGLLLARTGKSHEAVYHLRRALEVSPANRRAALALAKTYVVLGDKGAAVRTLNAALAHLGDDAHLLRFLSRLYEESGDYEAAARCLGTMLRSSPTDADALRRLASLRLKQGHYRLAHQLARRLLRILPDDPEGHRVAAAASAALGDSEGELRHLRIACRVDPHSATTLARFVERLISLEPLQAIPHARKLVSVMPQDAASWTLLGRAHIAAGDNDGAVYALRRAAALAPPDPTPHYLLARLLPSERQVHLRTALQVDTTLSLLPDQLRTEAFLLLARHRIKPTGKLLARYRFLFHLLPASVCVFENGVLVSRGGRRRYFVPYRCLAHKPVRRQEPWFRRVLFGVALAGIAAVSAVKAGLTSPIFGGATLLSAAAFLEALSTRSTVVFADSKTGRALVELPATQRGLKTAAKIERLAQSAGKATRS